MPPGTLPSLGFLMLRGGTLRPPGRGIGRPPQPGALPHASSGNRVRSPGRDGNERPRPRRRGPLAATAARSAAREAGTRRRPGCGRTTCPAARPAMPSRSLPAALPGAARSRGQARRGTGLRGSPRCRRRPGRAPPRRPRRPAPDRGPGTEQPSPRQAERAAARPGHGYPFARTGRDLPGVVRRPRRAFIALALGGTATTRTSAGDGARHRRRAPCA
jgi:hypothetical protein